MDAILLFLPVMAIIALLVFVYIGQNNTGPAWLQRTSFRIRLAGKWLLSIASVIFFLLVVLPLIVQEAAMWLFPESKFGYTVKYQLRDKKVFVDRKPYDCDWGTAPLGAKHCHYEKSVQTEKDQQGKVATVYVSWQKVQD
jgi:hypothetical protein